MIERTTVRLPRDLLLRAKRKAIAEQRTLTALIEEGLRLVLDAKRKPQRPDRGRLPLSSAAGGPVSDIDISDSASLQEMDDGEYVARMNRGQ